MIHRKCFVQDCLLFYSFLLFWQSLKPDAQFWVNFVEYFNQWVMYWKGHSGLGRICFYLLSNKCWEMKGSAWHQHIYFALIFTEMNLIFHLRFARHHCIWQEWNQTGHDIWSPWVCDCYQHAGHQYLTRPGDGLPLPSCSS